MYIELMILIMGLNGLLVIFSMLVMYPILLSVGVR